MCGYGATKCAGLVRQNARMWCDKMWWVWCDEMWGYGASKCAGIMRSAAIVRRNAAMVRRDGVEMATTSDDRSTRSNYICEQLRFLLTRTAFQSEALICTIETEIKCKSWLKCCDSVKTRFLSLQKDTCCLLSLLVHHQVIVALLVTRKCLMHNGAIRWRISIFVKVVWRIFAIVFTVSEI